MTDHAVRFLGFDLKRFPDRWMSGQDAMREIGGIITVFAPDHEDNCLGWRAAFEYGDNLRLLALASTLAEAEEEMRDKLRTVARWSLRAAQGKAPEHDCLACGFDGSTLTRNEPSLRLLAKCPNVDPRIRDDAAKRIAIAKRTP